MNTCDTCRFWYNQSQCEKPDQVERDKEINYSDVKLFVIQVRVSDDTSLDVKLRTGAKFGCVLHESRESTRPAWGAAL